MENEPLLEPLPPGNELAEPSLAGPSLEAPPVLDLRAGRALWIFVAFQLLQVLFVLLIGFACGLFYGIRYGRPSPELMAEMIRALTLPLSMISVALAGVKMFRMSTRHALGPLPASALLPLGWRGASWRWLVAGSAVGTGIACFYAFGLAPAYPPAPDHSWGPLVQALQVGGASRLMVALFALLIAPPVEEFLFRGVLWAGFSRSLGKLAAALGVTLLFVLCHIFEITDYWPAWIAIGLLGGTALLVRAQSGSLWPAILLHASYNLTLILIVYATLGA